MKRRPEWLIKTLDNSETVTIQRNKHAKAGNRAPANSALVKAPTHRMPASRVAKRAQVVSTAHRAPTHHKLVKKAGNRAPANSGQVKAQTQRKLAAKAPTHSRKKTKPKVAATRNGGQNA